MYTKPQHKTKVALTHACVQDSPHYSRACSTPKKSCAQDQNIRETIHLVFNQYSLLITACAGWQACVKGSSSQPAWYLTKKTTCLYVQNIREIIHLVLNKYPLLITPRMQENRRAYRELFITADFADSISGVILFEETLKQSTSSGQRFVDVLSGKGIHAGIKVDQGLSPLPGSPEETFTLGLDTLASRCRGYAECAPKCMVWLLTVLPF